MSNTKAFTYLLGPKLPGSTGQIGTAKVPDEEGGSTLGNTIGLIDQTSPTWVLTFVRWDIRDTLRTPSASPTAVRAPLVVENDCIDVTTTFNKATLTHSMSALLVETEINYADAVHPGDFVFVNMLNWESDARELAIRAGNSQPINGSNDGFKGFFKVQGVRKMIRVDPQTGTRTVLVKIDGFAFTEFNNTIYFNPNLINPKILGNQALFINDLSSAWASFVSLSGKPYLQEIIAFLIQSLIGSGVNPQAQSVSGLTVSPNVHFLMPLLVGKLLGIQSTHTLAARDIYNYIFGIQQYAGGQVQTLQQGMTPSNLNANPRYPKYPNFYYTTQFCTGNTLLKPEYWNQVTLWSILNQYTNAPMNELFSCFRIDPFTGSVRPTIVFRQIPFTSEDFTTQKFGVQDGNAATIVVTNFLSLPRWKIGSESIFSADLGTDEAARINFVQYYAKSAYDKAGADIAQETALHNYTFDANDIVRSGLRPYVVQNQFEDLPDIAVNFAPVWARIFGDAVIGGHLKVNGTLECIGIVEPITVGDNLEFDSVVFHIEQVVHRSFINPSNGIKTFRTTLSLSHGVNLNSSTQGTQYGQMANPNAYTDRANDYQNEQILPGVSESQDTVGRKTSVDGPLAKARPFAQPSTVPNRNGGNGNNNNGNNDG